MQIGLLTPNGKAALYAFTVFALCWFLAGCGTTGHGSCMHEFQNDPDTRGQNPLCTFEVKKQVAPRAWVKYYHQSFLSSGVPFNENEESTADAIGVEVQLW